VELDDDINTEIQPSNDFTSQFEISCPDHLRQDDNATQNSSPWNANPDYRQQHVSKDIADKIYTAILDVLASDPKVYLNTIIYRNIKYHHP
jgi:hypothetical protein